jgi:DNA-binding NarL/FixJ family response regulator
MNHRILIIDDESLQATNLQKAIMADRPGIFVDTASTIEDIDTKVRETYYNLAIVDLRMDKFPKNGIDIIKEIIEINPFTKIIVVSAFTKEYSEDLNDLIASGRMIAILDKEKFDVFRAKVMSVIDSAVRSFDANTNANQKALESLFSEAKNEIDTYQKGKKFEYFVTILFGQMGFNHIDTRFRDRSLNEVDLILRNELKDPFFQKFKQYILVECKNTSTNVDKNQFILFKEKLQQTAGLSDLGFLVTATGVKGTAYDEAIRVSDKDFKIIFISSGEIKDLISSTDTLDALKKIVDKQVKDN